MTASQANGNGTVHDAAALPQEELVREARDRSARPLEAGERRGEELAAVAFLVVAVPLALLLPSERSLDLSDAALLVGAFAIASRIRFEIGVGYTNPSQLVLVPMLFLLPTAAVPLLVAAGNLLGELPEYVSRRRHPQRVLITLADSSSAIGPALVLVLAGTQAPVLADWPIFLAALAAQLSLDLIGSAVREWSEFGVSPRSQLADTGWYLAVDALLSPVGLVLAMWGLDEAEVVLLIAPMFALFVIFAGQRRRGLETAIDLSEAYRGTTILLADVIEHDDHYTGSHSKGVVSLSMQVAREMGLDREQCRNVEFAALLHDVGKLAISKEIINKEGPLSSNEWALMKLHTITGEQMLGKIGGLFDGVAKIVRSSHERWDGSGYPDGLAGVAIPLEARIVSCCDAFNAMTTDRSYRAAMTTGEAIEELRRNAGTQFDPGVAWTVIRLVEVSERERFEPMLRTTDAGDRRPAVASASASLAMPVLQPVDEA